MNATKEEKRACPFSSSTPRRKKTTQSFSKVWASKLAESDKGSYYNQEKWLKDDKASEKPIETTAKSSFVEFKNYKIALSYSKVTTISIYPYLGHLKSNLSSSPFFNSSFIYFEKQRDQGAPVGDIFKSSFLANTVSELSTISSFFSTNDPEVSKYLFWHLRVGGRGVMERV